MKNSLFFIVLMFLVSCSVDPGWDGTIEPDNKTYFHPPTWIQGVWINEGRDSDGFKFTQNDFIIRYDESINIGVSYNERINYLSTEFLSCKEEKSTGRYKVTITHLTTNITVYDFVSISDNEVRCDYDDIESGVRTVAVYTLKKQ